MDGFLSRLARRPKYQGPNYHEPTVPDIFPNHGRFPDRGTSGYAKLAFPDLPISLIIPWRYSNTRAAITVMPIIPRPLRSQPASTPSLFLLLLSRILY